MLTTRELNRALLARQLLLERSPLSLATALERVAGLQSQYAPSAYVALWSRLRNFRRESLTAALERRVAVQATLMRSTIHVVSAKDFPLFIAGIREGRREWWLRANGKNAEGIDLHAMSDLLRRHLGGGSRTAAELKSLLLASHVPRVAWSGMSVWLEMVRVPPSGTWHRRRADLYALADGWLRSSPVGEADGVHHLVRRYLGGFGPAPINDIALWAGLAPARVAPILEAMHLRQFRDERGRVLFDVPGAPLPGPDAPAPVRFLPTWDATLLVHARRTLILPEAYRPLVFDTRTPHSVPTFLVDGTVAGTWRYDRGRVRVEAFAPLPRATQREVDEEAERLTAFHAD